MIRRYGIPPRPDQTYRRRPGAYAILRRADGKLLLTEQTTPDFVEVQLPGGGIDFGESAIPALIREIREETGHGAHILRHLGLYRRFTYMEEYGFHAEKLCHVFLGRVGPCLGPPLEPGHRALWATPAEAIRKVESPGDRAFLQSMVSRGSWP